MAAPAARAAQRASIIDAGLTAVLAFFLLLPLIGFRTVQNIRNEIVLETRWQMLFAFVAMAATGRLFYSRVSAPWRERRATQARPPAATVARLRPILARWFAPFC
ncbi:MAG: branched-chain amino acid transport system permease protein, partial [Alphaproteobacteria bacterium]|nr:branched-chain amino acid transport system permease protein [Alphaproteobacteria bacterium]